MYWHGDAQGKGRPAGPFSFFDRRSGMNKVSDRQNKAEQTTAAAWNIINSEANAREAKTARLRKAREAREAHEAEEAASAAPPAPKKKKSRARAK
jgi:hypothetical protein